MNTRLALFAVVAALTAPGAHAQDPACTRDLQTFVGLPVSGTLLASVGTLMADHFVPRTRDGRTTTVTQEDIKQLSRAYKEQGIGDCEMRREFQAMARAPTGGAIPGAYPGGYPGAYPGGYPGGYPYGGGPHPYGQAAGAFGARAVCGRARGSSSGQPSAQQAIAIAVDRCTARGGDPGCCASGAYLVR